MDIKNQKIVCIGEVLWDCFPYGDKPGGAPMNTAIHARKLGLNSHIITRVGNDNKGLRLIEFLSKSTVGIANVQIDETQKTGQVIVKLDEHRNASYSIIEPAAWDFLELTSSAIRLAKDAGIVVYGTLASRNKESRNTIQQLLNYDHLKVIDLNFRPPFVNPLWIEELIAMSDIIKLNSDELKEVAAWNEFHGDETELMKSIAAHYRCKMICLTKGENGAAVYADGLVVYHPGYTIKVSDTVGAGDAFLAGFLKGLTEGRSTSDMLAFACATGAYVASQPGATPDYQTESINAMMSKT